MITDDHVKEFKERMRITHTSEDDYLERILSASLADIKEKCGEFTLDNERGKELVFERSRYVYNDSLEFFQDNFQHQINSFAFELWGESSDTE